ncbi:MAG: TonB-dependent receptor [Sphingomonas adhaesiva]|uniref:TonB-dependent receptor domain-containing protein n=1 Tax=Sphingomonas adhaesiva TaxID=28212 RepID=UPI002FFA10A4
MTSFIEKGPAARKWIAVSALAMSVALATPAVAQTQQPPIGAATPDPAAEPAGVPQPAAPVAETAQEQAPANAADIIVTGSRVKRNGYKAPTPETVVSAQDLASNAPANVADFVNDLPQLAGSATPRAATTTVSSGTAGSNFLNLRGLGASRTLVLLDGRRVVGSSVEGLVDANTLPSALISRVDIVTGGASAAYGSDAVAGVVNFVLDTRFTGVKLEVQSGISTYGDDRKSKVEAAVGKSFAGGRGHIIVSGSYTDTAGVSRADSRPWFNGAKIIANPAFVAGGTQPRLILADNVNTANASFGGLITSGVLAGTQFGEGGSIGRRVFGTPAGAMYTIGGERQDLAAFYSLEAPVEQITAFGRVSFEIATGFELFGEFNYGRGLAKPQSAYNWAFGNVRIQQDNAFLDPTLRTRLLAAGQTSFLLGTFNPDLGRFTSRNERELTRYVGGLKGDLGGGWTVDAYGQYGKTAFDTSVSNLQIRSRYALAVDAVRNAAGQIVCRSTLTNPTDGCVPYNVFGSGVNTPEAIAYSAGTARLKLDLEQTVGAVTVQGEPFSTWAGPVSVAFGGEYRKEKVSGTSDAISQANDFFAGNYKPTNGSYDLGEGFGEVVVPIARDLPFAQSADLNGAVRYTHYSTSGGVTTWKVGATYNPVRDIRLRFTRSRDIRAPNLNDLYLGGVQSIGQTVIDRGVSTGNIVATTIGNQALDPERADTLTAGVVLAPTFLPGFTVSFDYYDIKIADAILTPSTQAVVNYCNAGNTAVCNLITRNAAGVITAITRSPINLARERSKGFDIEASYNGEIAPDARITVRALATHVIERSLNDGISVDQLGGENSVNPPGGSIADWRVNGSVGLAVGPYTAVFTGRYTSSGVYDRAFTAADLADNRIGDAVYFDLATSIKFKGVGGGGEFFFNVDNLFNRDPVIVAPINQPFFNAPVNALLYDTIGREFRAGVRVKF